MARRIGTRQTGRKAADGSRGGKEQSPRRRRPRSPTARPKRGARPAAERVGVERATREASVEPAGQSGSRDDAPVHGAAGESHPPGGVHLSVDALTIDAAQVEVERGALKAVVSVHRGDELLYRERVNLDWSGGRDKFLRKASRALAMAGIATRINEALLAEMRTALRRQAASAGDGGALRARS
jgi:hypothetical protein